MHDQESKPELSKSPYLLMPILLLMWGSLAAVSKLLLNQLDSYQLLFYMYGLGAAVFTGIVLVKAKPGALLSWKRAELALLLACGVLTFLYDFFYMKSLDMIPAVEASMLNYLFPLFIVLFAVPLHKEKLTPFKLLSLAMGLLGSVLLVTKGNLTEIAFTNLEGDLYAVLAAVSWGLFTNLVKKNRQDMLLSTFFITMVALLCSTVSLFTFSHWTVPQAADFYGVLWLSMSNIVMGFFLYFRALKYSPASLVASFTFFTPFVTLVFIVVLLGEKLTATDFIAAALIIFSVPVQRLRSKRRSLTRKEAA